MFTRPREYSLDELLEHPVLSVEMTNRGIERRCCELIFEAAGGHHRFSEIEYGAAGADLGPGPALLSPA